MPGDGGRRCERWYTMYWNACFSGTLDRAFGKQDMIMMGGKAYNVDVRSSVSYGKVFTIVREAESVYCVSGKLG